MAVITVTSNADSGAGTLRQAIADAQDGDVILFDADVFPEGVIPPAAIWISSQIAIDKSITINGDGRATIDGQSIVRCFYIATADVEVVLSGITLMNGSGAGGGGVYVASSANVTMNNCDVESCSSTTHGGGVLVRDTAQVTLVNCALVRNSATNNGGGVYVRDSATATLTNCGILSNGATNGQALYSTQTSTVVVANCSLSLGAGTTMFGGSGAATVIDSRLPDVDIGASVTTTIEGATVIDTFYARNGSTVTLEDGAGLAITSAATVTGATITSAGRSYLALADDVDVSAARVANSVIQCEYGAGIVDFSAAANKDVATIRTTQTDATVSFLLETLNDDAWETVSATASSGLQAPIIGDKATFRVFDGEKFLTATVKPDYGKWNYTPWTPVGWTLKDWNYKRL